MVRIKIIIVTCDMLHSVTLERINVTYFVNYMVIKSF